MNKINLSSIAKKITDWYKTHQRELPWRKTKDPYHIWLSEIILQQTRISQGLSYYHKLSHQFPNIRALANAPLTDVLKTWQGLGYYSRARNMHKTAKIIAEHYQGNFPDDYKQLLKLPGIGPYTGAAIISIAFEQAYAVVDGNVSRVLARIFNIQTPINSTGGKKQFQHLAGQMIQNVQPSDFNQAMMDFGAILCSPQNPKCSTCPVKNYCQAYQLGKTEDLPVKIPSKKQKNRHFHYLFIEEEGYT